MICCCINKKLCAVFRLLLIFCPFLLLILYSSSCKENRGELAENIQKAKAFILNQGESWREIDVEKAVEIDLIEYANLITERKYIYLDSDSLIGSIDRLLVFKDKIYILDFTVKEKIFIFKLSGELIKIINNQGRGPEEYIGLSDISIDSINNELIVNDRLRTGVLHYTLDGEYIKKTESIPCTQSSFFGKRQLNRLYFEQSFNRNVNNEIVLAENDSIIRSGFQMSDFQRHIGDNRSSFSKNSLGNLLFTPIGSDTVYQFVTDSSYRVRYVIKQNKSLWSLHKEQVSENSIKNAYVIEGYTQFDGPIYETTDYVSFLISEGDPLSNRVRLIQYIFDKKKNNLYRIEPRKEIENFKSPFLVEIPPFPVTTYGDYFVGQWDAMMIDHIKQVTSDKNNPKKIASEGLNKIIINYPKNGNPVICMFKYH